jgi:hypothetical protein
VHKKFFYQLALFSVLISFAFVNIAGAHITNSGSTSSFYDNGSKHPNIINGNNSNDSNWESNILARSDKSKKSKKSEKSKKSDKSKKSEKSLKSEKSKKSEKSDKSKKSKKRGKSKGKGKGKKKGHNK